MKYDEEKLWIAVIERAIKDAAVELKKEAIKWFDSESFETVCELANLSSSLCSSLTERFEPLHLAAQKGYREIVEILLNNNADPEWLCCIAVNKM